MSDSSNSSSEIDNKRIKTGGRQKGTLNKRTVWLRESLERVDIDFEMQLKSAFETKDYKMIELLQGFLPYLSPKLREREVDQSSEVEQVVDEGISTDKLVLVVKGAAK